MKDHAVNMSDLLDEVDLATLGTTPRAAALNVLRRQSARLARFQHNRDTLVLMARELGASYADIAEAAGFTAQTAANICQRRTMPTGAGTAGSEPAEGGPTTTAP